MGLFAWSEEKIARETARLVAERDLAGLAGELDEHDQRRRGAAAAALGSFGADAVPAIVAATLTGGDDARRGAWAAFAAVGTTATAQVTARVMSMETLLSGDVPATLRYFERAVAAIGPGSQGDIAALVSGDGPWRERARACLQVRDSRDARVNREPVPGGHVLMPISLGQQPIDVEQAEEVLRATTREWAVTCFLDLTETDAVLHDGTIAALEAAVLDAVGEESELGADGLPEMAPVTILHRHLAGERGVLTRLQTDVQAARISPAEYAPAERRRREDLLVGTLALADLRNYARKGAGLGLSAMNVAERFARPSGSSPGDGAAAFTSTSASLLAGFALCCEMHLGEPAAALADEPSLAPLLTHETAPGTRAVIDKQVVLNVIRTLRGAA